VKLFLSIDCENEYKGVKNMVNKMNSSFLINKNIFRKIGKL